MAREASPEIRPVPVDRPWQWLARGWGDLACRPAIALAYGGAVVLLSYALAFAAWSFERQFLVLPLAAGFFLVAPLVAVGLYETSRRIEAGEPATLGAALVAWRRNRDQIALMGLVLLLCHLAWVRVATLLFALFFDAGTPTLAGVAELLLTRPQGLRFLALGTAIGFGFACLTFALAAVAIPMLLDRDTHAAAAIGASLRCVRANWKPMALWAALIVVFTAMGIATAFIGLAVTMPLIGFATWHAYRDMVG